jgi:ABC-type Mn2+/Zn2+ transport system ATPase subunit
LILSSQYQQKYCYAKVVLRVEDLTVKYGEHTALEGANVEFKAACFTAVIGPNGAGKSTLLKTAVGLSSPAIGRVILEKGVNVPQDIAYVPQQHTLDWTFPVTVWDMAMMGRTGSGRLGWLRWPSREDKQRVIRALEQTGVYDLRSKHIAALSGGQKQRVLLARMLVRNAKILLLDEPLTGVDVVTQKQLMRLLRLQAAAGCAVVMVTHDLEQAKTWCDQLILINKRVIAQGKPDEVYTPQNIEATFSSSYLGHTHAEA